ncbi:MAG: hypothetical protein IKR48_06825 [Kiritimatiellae bacterium]|nr:hypothetical protein [Kiritimatiellia bacterium]
MKMRLVLLLALVALNRGGYSADIWYQVSTGPDRLWTTTNGWINVSTPLGHLPSFVDCISMNSGQTGPDNPLVIPADCEAICKYIHIATLTGNANNYVSDGRIPSLTLYGTLRTPSNSWDLTSISVGEAYGGYGLMRIEEGALITNACLTVGKEGIGVVTNNGGSLYFPIGAERNLTVGAQTTGFGTYVQNKGILSGKKHIGHYATGTVEVAGGVLTNGNIYVGVRSEGKLDVRGGTVYGVVACGYGAQGHGVLEMSGGRVVNDPIIGREGHGEFRYRGGTESFFDLIFGQLDGGHGELDVDANRTLSVDGTLFCGYEGRGTAMIRSTVQQAYLKIGGNTNHVSEMTIPDDGTNLVTTSINLGGYPIPVTGGLKEMYGCGFLTLQGGTVRFTTSSANTVNFNIGRYTNGWGCLRGYGKIAPSSPGATNIRIGGGNCIFFADGDGVERDLDLHEVVNVTNYFAELDVATSTNGWYAENKGRVLYPRTWFGTATAERCFGDAPYAPTPRFVNSVRFSIKGVSGSNSFFRGGLYATDRTDIPAGLPLDLDVIGVWGFGLFNNVTTTGKVSFSKFSLTFRYDHTKVSAGKSVCLYRYDGTQWVQVGSAIPNDDHLISTRNELSPISTGTMNVGFFAVGIRNTGTIISIR